MCFFCFWVWQCMLMKLKQRKINKNYLRWKINYNININFYIVVEILENCRSFLSIIFTPRSQDCSEGFDAIFHSLWCWWLGRLPLNSYLRSSLCLFLFGQFDINFADNFLSQVIFVFLLFLGMAVYANEVETKEN